MMKKCILVDGSGLVYRGFYAIPPFLKSPNGIQTNAVFGFTNILLSILSQQKPDYMAVAFDRKGPTFRHKEFTAYKATRVKAPQSLYDQIPLVKKVIDTFKIPLFEAEGFEADDILATLVKKLSPQKNIEILLATGDFDMFQIASPKVFILYPVKGFKYAEILRVTDIEKRYNLTPEQIVDYKSLAGDSSDNIPGVRGIGEKSAKKLLHQYKTVDNIYAHLTEIDESLRKKLEDGRENAFLSKRLATLQENVPLEFDLHSFRVQDFDISAARKIFEEFGFKSLLKRLDELYGIGIKQETLF